MNKHNQDGAANGLVISLILTVLLLFGALGFGYWAFASREDYKNNVDSKIQTAVDKAVQQESTLKDKQFAEEAKNPLKAYAGPEAYGSLKVDYPKTWSAYVDDSGSGNAVVDGYFAPATVPSITNKDSVFALRIQVLNQAYGEVLKPLTSQQQSGKISASAYALPKLPKIVGVKLVGQVNASGNSNQQNITMIVLPLRSQTLEIWTQGNQYLNDFNKNILPNFSFSP